MKKNFVVLIFLLSILAFPASGKFYDTTATMSRFIYSRMTILNNNDTGAAMNDSLIRYLFTKGNSASETMGTYCMAMCSSNATVSFMLKTGCVEFFYVENVYLILNGSLYRGFHMNQNVSIKKYY